ncbi:MAG: dynamin family protein [Selenomonadaceae bacterium]|nr:dynamin family protein [Selenomonadaceae bacterium]
MEFNDKKFDKDYLAKVEKLRYLLAEATNLTNELSSWLTQDDIPEFQIALVGTIKAGKSTLINALLNYELASTCTTPETAALTKFKRSDRNFVQISFYNEDEWNTLWASVNNSKSGENIFLEEYNAHNAEYEKAMWLGRKEQKVECDNLEKLKDEIGKWTSSKSACHYFVKEVLVGIKDINLPYGVVLVDTPGLDDVVEFRSNITREYIDRAGAVFVCSKPDGFTGRTMMTLTKVLDRAHDNIEKVYMIVTQIDTINNPKKTWENDLQKEWVRYLKGESKYRSEDLAKRNLIPVSAYLYTMLQDYKEGRLKEDDDRYFDLGVALLKLGVRENQLNDHFDELIAFTNIKFLENKINTEIVAKRK